MQAVVKEITAIIGLDKAIELVRGWGGRELSVPKKMKTDHAIVFAIGLDAAIKLADAMGGQRLRLPLEKNALLELRNALILKEFQEGTSITRLGNRYGLTRSAVTKILRALGAHPPPA
jgi:Mor transcription activator family